MNFTARVECKLAQLDSTGFEYSQNLRRVPRFSAGQPSPVQIDTADIVTSIITVLFGAIHCFAWSFHFPSHTEQLLWRIASVITAALPVIWGVVYTLSLMDDLENQEGKRIHLKTIYTLSSIVVPLYLIARLILLVLAFTTLRSLPVAAYETVYWTTFIPHI